MSEQRTHDMGGNEAGEVEFTDHDLAPWQKEVFAMRQVLGGPDRQLIRVDELRRAIEDLPEEQYAMAYFDRWVRAVRTLVVEKGVLKDEEIAARMEEIRKARLDA